MYTVSCSISDLYAEYLLKPLFGAFCPLPLGEFAISEVVSLNLSKA